MYCSSLCVSRDVRRSEMHEGHTEDMDLTVSLLFDGKSDAQNTVDAEHILNNWMDTTWVSTFVSWLSY